jgi:hypothetical protein
MTIYHRASNNVGVDLVLRLLFGSYIDMIHPSVYKSSPTTGFWTWVDRYGKKVGHAISSSLTYAISSPPSCRFGLFFLVRFIVCLLVLLLLLLLLLSCGGWSYICA